MKDSKLVFCKGCEYRFDTSKEGKYQPIEYNEKKVYCTRFSTKKLNFDEIEVWDSITLCMDRNADLDCEDYEKQV